MEKIPDQKELERELNKYLEKKYGDKVRLVVSALEPRPQPQERGGKGERKKQPPIDFDIKPEELISYLNTFIVKQDEAKEILATKICTHYNRIKYFLERGKEPAGVGSVKNNIIMIGPTGVGKTYMVKLIARRIGVPFVKGDATKFSETGYVGGDVEDLVRDLVQEAGGDIERAQYGIIYIDEIDKIASSGNIIGPDVSRTGVQRALLKPMEETEVDLKAPHDPIAQMEAIEHYRRTGKRQRRSINTRNILFIVSGAFSGLEDIIRRRMSKEGIGFGQDVRSKVERAEYLKHVTPEDLIEYGFESEFVGRLPVVAVFEPLGRDDLYAILKNPNSPIITSKKRDFRAYGIEIVFEDEALRKIAELAYRQKTGARALVSVVERVLLKFERRLPSTGIRQLVVTKEMVEDPEGELQRLLENPTDEAYRKRFEEALQKEREEIKRYILSRRGEFEERYGPLFRARRVELLVDRLVSREDDLNGALEELWRCWKQVKAFERGFKERYGIEISFEEEAIDALLTLFYKEGRSPKDVFMYLEGIYEPALRLLLEKVAVPCFVIPRKGVEDPERYFNDLIKEYYQRSYAGGGR
ncbi:MAG: ATPase [Deltaproteobacteria bacterium]|nr:MAG: ATPase [Deltaproteobacteria bacterium]HEX16592.1 AAA family ATPase [Deltaproteobacteria bacterium]